MAAGNIKQPETCIVTTESKSEGVKEGEYGTRQSAAGPAPARATTRQPRALRSVRPHGRGITPLGRHRFPQQPALRQQAPQRSTSSAHLQGTRVSIQPAAYSEKQNSTRYWFREALFQLDLNQSCLQGVEKCPGLVLQSWNLVSEHFMLISEHFETTVCVSSQFM
ncbi:hypothetical protein RRG08_018255 [Elysia crispata]|uniref:Uncharacterized protein n=1 Tax=Elysia crispata TaxID=231223 RepID=A0AAE0Z3N0_9GAST|nr:hypothetical protein RRG08_018255 [Elysia crispata]